MSLYSTSQIQHLQEIGEALRQHRQAQNIPLEEIANRTYIQLRMLKALEEGKFETLPEPVFVRGFIFKYANEIGLPGAQLADEFMGVRVSTVAPKAPPKSPSTPPKVTGPVANGLGDEPIPPSFLLSSDLAASDADDEIESVSFGESVVEEPVAPSFVDTSLTEIQPIASTKPPKPLKFSSRSTPGIPAPMILLVAVVAIGSVAAFFALPRLRIAQQSPEPLVPASPVATAPASPSPSPVAKVPDPDAPLQVAVTLTGDSWMQVEVDGKPDFEGTLSKGSERSWVVQKQLTLQVGNAGDVLVSVNGGESKPIGEPGEVREVTITPANFNSVLNKSSGSEPNLTNTAQSTVNF